jgi:RNA-directed DNA polymerase
MLDPSLLNVLASSLMAGDQNVPSLVSRIEKAIGKRGLPALAARYHEAFLGRTRPRRQDVLEFLRHDRGVPHIRTRHAEPVTIAARLVEPSVMVPVPAAKNWKIPAITSMGELRDWLNLTTGELEWFADIKGLNRRSKSSALAHYRYSIVSKRNGDVRLIEAPKPRLKQLQRIILAEILDPIPKHEAAHGFVRGRSIQSSASPHAGKRVVLRMDLKDFFPSIHATRIQAFFRTAGYPDPVATLLCGICTNSVPNAAWREHRRTPGVEKTFDLQHLYRRRHLPQGAPTSPALANLCAYRLDARLTGLAKSADAVYTRYADDLAFSGGEEFARQSVRFSDQVAAILIDEGCTPHFRKTRIMRQSVRQQLCGMVINSHLNIGRQEFDRLKATLTNCVKHGPATQNRDAVDDFQSQLRGKIGFVESVNPARGAKLRAIFKQIPR